jgi:hypothetical protein
MDAKGAVQSKKGELEKIISAGLGFSDFDEKVVEGIWNTSITNY